VLPEHPICPAEEYFLLRVGSTCSLYAAGPEVSLHLPLAARPSEPGMALLPARAAVAEHLGTDDDLACLRGCADYRAFIKALPPPAKL
jgi:hypothetical protein